MKNEGSEKHYPQLTQLDCKIMAEIINGAFRQLCTNRLKALRDRGGAYLAYPDYLRKRVKRWGMPRAVTIAQVKESLSRLSDHSLIEIYETYPNGPLGIQLQY